MNRPFALSVFSVWLIVGLLILPACRSTKPGPTGSLSENCDQYLQKLYEEGAFNGNALIYKAGEIQFQSAYGIANIAPIDSLSLASVFRLASVSKQFTAMAIMMLQEDGKLSVYDPLQKHIPELPYQNINLHHLMTHTSGLPDYVSLLYKHWKPELEEDDPARLIPGNETIIAQLAEHQPKVRFEPGEKWEYSNTAYVLLASIVARVAELPFEQFLKDRIFDPLGMDVTSVYAFKAGPDPDMPLRTYGYREKNGKRSYNDVHFLNGAQGDGGMYSTLADLLKWDRALYTEQLISAQGLETIYTAARLNDGSETGYGYGVGIGKSPTGKKAIAHSGGWVGYATHIYRAIEEDACIIVLTNHSNNGLGDIIKQLKEYVHALE